MQKFEIIFLLFGIYQAGIFINELFSVLLKSYTMLYLEV